MKQLTQVRNNIFYTKDVEGDEPNFKRINEIVMLFDGADYHVTNEGSVIRQRKVEEFRFHVTQEGLKTLIEVLEQYHESTEEDLT